MRRGRLRSGLEDTHQELDATTGASKIRVNSVLKGGLWTLPERADATEVAAAPRKERKETFNACGGGQPKNEGGGRKGGGRGEAYLLAIVYARYQLSCRQSLGGNAMQLSHKPRINDGHGTRRHGHLSSPSPVQTARLSHCLQSQRRSHNVASCPLSA